ncbi:MAG TPA: chorismate mutase, partial [Acetobacteraceae bacterium]|nr:chorismate mutase [Acetobacteraceae bacterium]
DPSGQDRSLLGLTLAQETSRARLAETLAAAALPPLTLILRRDPGEPVRALAEVEGFMTDDDPRLARVGALAPVLLGAYATPEMGEAT